jgi:hypothetical protein
MTTYVYNEHDENQVLTMRNKLKKDVDDTSEIEI